MNGHAPMQCHEMHCMYLLNFLSLNLFCRREKKRRESTFCNFLADRYEPKFNYEALNTIYINNLIIINNNTC